MGDYVVRPEKVKLTLPAVNGDEPEWILVKKALNYGEWTEALKRRYYTAEDGKFYVNPVSGGMVSVLAYLLDWNLTDPAGEPIPIRGLDSDALTTILNTLSVEKFGEIRGAIEAHEKAVTVARAEAKKKTAGTPPSAVISASPSAATGDSPGSANLNSMSETSSSTS